MSQHACSIKNNNNNNLSLFDKSSCILMKTRKTPQLVVIGASASAAIFYIYLFKIHLTVNCKSASARTETKP